MHPGKAIPTVLVAGSLFLSTINVTAVWASPCSGKTKIRQTRQIDDLDSVYRLFYEGAYERAMESSKKLPAGPRSAYIRGRILLATGKMDDAYQAFSEALGDPQTRGDSCIQMANILWSKGRKNETYKLFTDQLRLIADVEEKHCMNKQFCEWMFGCAWYEGLLKMTDAWLASHPDDAIIIDFRARALQGTGHSKEADEAIQQAIRLQPHNPLLYCSAAVLLAKQRHKDAALKMLETCTKTCPDTVVPHFGRLMVFDLFRSRSETLAEKDLMSIAEPKTAQDLRCYSHQMMFFDAQQLGRVLSHLEKFKDLLPDAEYEHQHLLFKLTLARRQHLKTESVELARKLVQQFPSADSYGQMELIQSTFGDDEAAARSIMRACELEPFRYNSLHSKARILLRRNKIAQALEVLTTAERFGPESEGLRRERAQALCLLGKISELDEELQQLQKLGAYFTRVDIARRASQYAGGASVVLKNYADWRHPDVQKDIKKFEHMEAQAGNSDFQKDLELRLASLYMLDRAYEKAIVRYNKLIEKEPDNYRLYMHRGAAYFASGDKVKGRMDQRIARKLFRQSEPSIPVW